MPRVRIANGCVLLRRQGTGINMISALADPRKLSRTEHYRTVPHRPVHPDACVHTAERCTEQLMCIPPPHARWSETITARWRYETFGMRSLRFHTAGRRYLRSSYHTITISYARHESFFPLFIRAEIKIKMA